MTNYPSFVLTSRDSRAVQEVFGAVSRLVDEFVLDVSQTGIGYRVVDAADTVLVVGEFDSDTFSQANVSEGRVGVDADALSSAVDEPNRTDEITLVGSPDDEEITVESPGLDEDITVDMQDPANFRDSPAEGETVDGLDYTTTVDVDRGNFRRVIRAAKTIGPMGLVMGVADDGGSPAFKMFGEGDVSTILGFPDHTIKQNPSGGLVGGIYTFEDYLEPISLALPKISTEVEFAFPSGTDKPFRVQFETSGDAASQVTIYVTPRIPTDSTDRVSNLSTVNTTDSLLDNPDFAAETTGKRGGKLFNTLSAIGGEYRMIATKTGLESRSVPTGGKLTTAQVVNVEPTYFDSYREIDGFPDRPLGITDRQISGLLRVWTQTQSFAFLADTDGGMMELAHDTFRAEIGMVRPEAIQSDISLPDVDLTVDLSTPVSDFKSGAARTLASAEEVGLVDTGPNLYLVNVDEETYTNFTASNASDVVSRGKGGAIFNTEIVQTVLDALPEEGRLTLQWGNTLPLVAEAQANGLKVTSTVAPRIKGDGSREGDETGSILTEILDDVPESLDFLTEGVTGREVFTPDAVSEKSIEERMKEQRLQTFPIDAEVRAKRFGSGDEFEIPESEDMAVEDETIDAALEEATPDTENVSVDSGDTIADVTFTSPTEYDLTQQALEPDPQRRFSTDDGIQFRTVTRGDSDELLYLTNNRETPSRYQIAVRATETEVRVGPKPPEGGVDKSDEIVIRDGLDSLLDAYRAMLDYVEGGEIREIVADAGVATDISRKTSIEAFEDVFDGFIDWRADTADSNTANDPYLQADTSGALFPDTTYRGTVFVNNAPPGEPYEVVYDVSFHVKTPAYGEAAAINKSRELAGRTVGYADKRTGIAPLAEEAMEEMRSIEGFLARESPDDPKPVSSRPSAMEGDSDSVTRVAEFVFPDSLSVIRAQVRDATVGQVSGPDENLPLNFQDISGIGPARAETFEDAGIDDMVDYTAVASSVTPSYWLGGVIMDLPDEVQDTVKESAGTIWARFVWPKREFPDGFDTAPTEDAERGEPREEGVTSPVEETEEEPEPVETVDLPRVPVEIVAEREAMNVLVPSVANAPDEITGAVKRAVTDAFGMISNPNEFDVSFQEGDTIGKIIDDDREAIESGAAFDFTQGRELLRDRERGERRGSEGDEEEPEPEPPAGDERDGDPEVIIGAMAGTLNYDYQNVNETVGKRATTEAFERFGFPDDPNGFDSQFELGDTVGVITETDPEVVAGLQSKTGQGVDFTPGEELLRRREGGATEDEPETVPEEAEEAQQSERASDARVEATIDDINSVLEDANDKIAEARRLGIMEESEIGRLIQEKNELDRRLEQVSDEPTGLDVTEARAGVDTLRKRVEEADERLAKETEPEVEAGEEEPEKETRPVPPEETEETVEEVEVTEIDRRVGDKATDLMRAAKFPVTDPPAVFSKEGNVFQASPDVSPEFRPLLAESPPVLRSEPGQIAREFAADYVREIYNMATDDVQSQVDKSVIDAATEQRETERAEGVKEGERDFRTDLGEPFSKMLDTALANNIPKVERGTEMATILENSGLFQEEVPGLFTEAVVGLNFPMGGASGGRGFAEDVSIKLGGELGQSEKRSLAIPSFVNLLTVTRPLIELDQAWGQFTDLVALVNPEMDKFSATTEKLVNIKNTTAFEIQNGRVNWDKTFLDADDVGLITSLSTSFYTQDLLPAIESESMAWYAAQQVKQLQDTGADAIERLIQDQLEQNPARGSSAWYLENAYRMLVDESNFDPVLYAEEWHGVFRPGETKTQAQRRRGQVDLDTLGRPNGAQPTQPSPEPTREPTPEPDVSEPEPRAGRREPEQPEASREDQPESEEPSVEELKRDIRDRL